MKVFYTPIEVTRLLDITYRRIQYLDESNILSPSYKRSGRYRLYTFKELACLHVLVTLRKSGFSLQKISGDILPFLKEALKQDREKIFKTVIGFGKKGEILICDEKPETFKMDSFTWVDLGELELIIREGK